MSSKNALLIFFLSTGLQEFKAMLGVDSVYVRYESLSPVGKAH